MADAAITFLLENLTQILVSFVDLVSGAENELKQLQKELNLLQAFLQQAANMPEKEKLLRETERQIREVVYEAEDTIDACLTQAAAAKTSRIPFRSGTRRIGLAKQVKSLREDKVKPMFDKLPQISSANKLITGEGSGTKPEEPWTTRLRKAELIREDNIVGFEDEEKKIIEYLCEKTKVLDVVSIIGMPGLGKTTLAWKIYQNGKIQEDFPVRIWVYVSQELNTRDLFLKILKIFTKEDKSSMSEHDLAMEVRDWLENEKFLLFLDDVWTTEAWDAIKFVLPKRNNSGKVLITSRDRQVGAHANVNREPHLLRFLKHKESWELLQLEVFGNLEDWPEHLKGTGKAIAQQCAGLPLAIVVVGGILLDQYSTAPEMNAIQDAWTNVSENVSMHVNDKVQGISDIVGLSYNKLPDDLRDCFLYLGVFPEDYAIPAWTLTRLWIAEGFIQRKKGQNLEETAEENLKNLINKNLVIMDKRKPNGEVKTCRVHDVIREFCKSKAAFEEQNLFQEVKMSKHGDFEPPVADIKIYRRLCMHFHLPDFLSKCLSEEQKCKHVRSFLCFSKDPVPLHSQYISAIPDTFDLLRILDSKSVKFNEFPKKVTKLFPLRYITLSCDNLNILPDTISKLWNLQTLVVDTKERTLEIKANIWKLTQLRHLKTKAAIILAIQGGAQGGENLQTLSRLSPKSCTQDVFKRACNLKRLGIRGDLAILFKAMSLEILVRLENLKLVNDLVHGSAVPSLVLPPHNRFPPNIKTLTLSATFLEWRHMSTLAKIGTLEVLKLKDKAFMGRSWQVDRGFRSLRFLLIASTDLRIWEASDGHFPSLKYLILKNCRDLCNIPFCLKETLQTLDIEHVSKSAVESARDIEEDKKRTQGQQKGRWDTKFKLNVGRGCE